jgi:hypothetical protein
MRRHAVAIEDQLSHAIFVLEMLVPLPRRARACDGILR